MLHITKHVPGLKEIDTHHWRIGDVNVARFLVDVWCSFTDATVIFVPKSSLHYGCSGRNDWGRSDSNSSDLEQGTEHGGKQVYFMPKNRIQSSG